MQNILEIVTFDAFLGVGKVEEFLHELRRHVDLQRAHFHGLIDNKLEEKFVDTLQVRPGWVHFFLLVDTSLSEVQIALFDVREGSEDVFLDHLHDFVEVGDDHAHHIFLVLKHLLKLSDGIKALSL